MFGFGAMELLIVAVVVVCILAAGRFSCDTRQIGKMAGLFQRYRKQWLKLKSLLRLSL